jgi:hypothetical protein
MLVFLFGLAKKFIGTSGQSAPAPAAITPTNDAAKIIPQSAIEHAVKLRAALREKLTVALPDGRALDLSAIVLGEAYEASGMAYISAPTFRHTRRAYIEFPGEPTDSRFSLPGEISSKNPLRDANNEFDVGELAGRLCAHIDGDVSRAAHGIHTFLSLSGQQARDLIPHHAAIGTHMKKLAADWQTLHARTPAPAHRVARLGGLAS